MAGENHITVMGLSLYEVQRNTGSLDFGGHDEPCHPLLSLQATGVNNQN